MEEPKPIEQYHYSKQGRTFVKGCSNIRADIIFAPATFHPIYHEYDVDPNICGACAYDVKRKEGAGSCGILQEVNFLFRVGQN